MSTIDKEKDDLATQQMLEMMQDADNTASEQLADDFDVDALLNEIDDIENDSEPESTQQINTDEENIDSSALEEIPTSDDELSAAMQDMAEALDTQAQEDLSDDIPADQLTDDFVDELVMSNDEASAADKAQTAISDMDDLQLVDDMLIDEAPQLEQPTEVEEVLADESIETVAENEAVSDDALNIDFDPELAQQILSASQASLNQPKNELTEDDHVVDSELSMLEENTDSLLEEHIEKEYATAEVDSDQEVQSEPVAEIENESATDEEIEFSNSDSYELGEEIDSAEQADDLTSLDVLTDNAMQEDITSAEVELESQNVQAETADESDPNMTPEKRRLLELVDETNQSVEAMSESIELEQQSHKIIEQLSTTAKMTTKVALSTTEKAQSATENAQQAIEKTFAAIERARQITQQAKYQIDMQTLKNYDDEQLDKILNQLKTRNQELQKTNNELAERVAKLYQS